MGLRVATTILQFSPAGILLGQFVRCFLNVAHAQMGLGSWGKFSTGPRPPSVLRLQSCAPPDLMRHAALRDLQERAGAEFNWLAEPRLCKLRRQASDFIPVHHFGRRNSRTEPSSALLQGSNFLFMFLARTRRSARSQSTGLILSTGSGSNLFGLTILF